MIKKVLIVDDEEDLRDLVAELLRAEGFDIRVAHDGADALKVVEDFHPDFVITDVRMPVCNGIDLLKKLSHLNPPPIPVLLMSGFIGSSELENIELANYKGFMTKPLNMEKVIEKLREN